MKNLIFFLAMLFSAISFSQQQNQSKGTISTSIGNLQNGEVFRFQPGLVTQLPRNGAFGFTNKWFSIGGGNTGSQNVFGIRFQLPNKALTMGYQDVSDENPRIQWISNNGINSDFEFRTANSFTNVTSTLVATMTKSGNTFFGNNASLLKSSFFNSIVGIDYTQIPNNYGIGLIITNRRNGYNNRSAIYIRNLGKGNRNTGLRINSTNNTSDINRNIESEVSGGKYNTAFYSRIDAGGRSRVNFGLRSIIKNPYNSDRSYAVFGQAPTNPNWYAGYFNGNVTIAGNLNLVSDERLKTNIEKETNVIDKLAQLKAVNYNYKENTNLHLPKILQHGFIAQNMEEVFPELVRNELLPIYDKENNHLGDYEYKSVNYIGLISILTASVTELNEKVKTLETELEAIKSSNTIKNNSNDLLDNKTSNTTKDGFSMEQNKPNPFNSRTVIQYTIPKNTKASIAIFNMSGKLLKEYNLTQQKGELTIGANEIGKGMFLYSLISNTEIIDTKKMLIK